MNVKSVEKKEKNSAELTVEVSAEEFEAAVNSAYKKKKIILPFLGSERAKPRASLLRVCTVRPYFMRTQWKFSIRRLLNML